MYSGYSVVDVDAHYMDRISDVTDYLDDDDPWKQRFQKGGELQESGGIKSFFPKSTEQNVGFDEGPYDTGPSVKSKEDILEAMDFLDIDAMALISNQALLYSYLEAEDARPVKFANAYIDFILDKIADPEEGIYAVLPLPYSSPREAVELIDRVGDEPAVIAAMLVSAGPNPPLGNEKYDPIYEICEQRGLPVIFHGGGSSVDRPELAGYSSHLETHTLGFLWANMAQLTSIVAQGIPEKYPNLDIIFQESGLFYVPTMMYRMDAEYLRSEWEAPLLEKRPSEYMKEFYYGTQPIDEPPNEKYLEYVIEMMGGADRIMYASDYPHPDYDHPRSITDLSFLTDEEKDKILHRNAEEVFGI